MPELPEVEHARRQLSPLVGRTITRVTPRDTIVLGGRSKPSFTKALAGRTLERVERRGKNLLVRLSGEGGLAMHLGMTGSLVVAPSAFAPSRFARVSFELGDLALHFDDPRKLGRLAAGSLDEARKAARMDALGPDALEVSTPHALAARFAGARGPIKMALLDQERIAGLGNIHASEALFLARLHPLRRASSLTAREWQHLHAGIRETLGRALDELDRLDANGEPLVYLSAGGENPFLVYDREGEPCPRCGRAIAREVHGGRSSYLCRHCQPRPRSTRRAR